MWVLILGSIAQSGALEPYMGSGASLVCSLRSAGTRHHLIVPAFDLSSTRSRRFHEGSPFTTIVCSRTPAGGAVRTQA